MVKPSNSKSFLEIERFMNAEHKFEVLAAVSLNYGAFLLEKSGFASYTAFLEGLFCRISELTGAVIFASASKADFFILTDLVHLGDLSQIVSDYSAKSEFCLGVRIGYTNFDCNLASGSHAQRADAVPAIDVSLLTTRAEMALQMAWQRNHIMCAFDTASLDFDTLSAKMQSADVLRRCLADGFAKLLFQPIVSAKDGCVYCYESLLRLLLGNQVFSAGSYIGQAEQVCDIQFLDRWVLAQAISALEAHPSVVLSINVAATSLSSPAWLDYCLELLGDRMDLAERIIFEITETSRAFDEGSLLAFINAMRNINAKIAIDDFGSGNTSFLELIRYPVDVVKVDGRFAKEVVSNARCREFIAILVDISHRSGIKVVAEMVETKQQEEAFKALGVDLLQGNFIAKPGPLPKGA